ncbi:MAG: DUF2807 domain-containing protein [Flavobacterium sp. MedPE-SWcel]|uniref:GIN domain-containing protein n=1 Tax=uncultured Flavobacterium sp. TaxID=165435 RepID=UPI00091998C1|nr:DUF2807 domain-containing protein [uncultured Flavobacterium sp.]OIQ16198.1 MAG: DUF2807 domain-containing protein [Flavobacterium sp. MedPE-SWcel]
MKNVVIIVFTVLFSTVAIAQKKEKIKGSRTVSVTQKEVSDFNHLEVEDNLEVFLIKGDEPALEIEADDNLHEVIVAETYAGKLRITTSKRITSSKKLIIRITYTDELTAVTVKHEVILNAIESLELDNITIKNIDYSKSYLNVKSKNFSLSMDNKTKAEINVQEADSTTIVLSKSANLKALIASQSAKIDLYQKTKATIEGDAAQAQIRIDNNAEFEGKRFAVESLKVLTEGYSNCNVLATETISISASGKTEIQLYGEPKVDIELFADNAKLYKKE